MNKGEKANKDYFDFLDTKQRQHEAHLSQLQALNFTKLFVNLATSL